MTGTQLRAAVRLTEQLSGELDLVELTDGLAHHAGELAEQAGLRGYDAVHLAAAHTLRDDDHVVVALDTDLRKAAAASGLNTAQLG